MKRLSHGITDLIVLFTLGMLAITLVYIFQSRLGQFGSGLSQASAVSQSSFMEYQRQGIAFKSPLATPTPIQKFGSPLATPTPKPTKTRTPSCPTKISGQISGIYAVSNYGERLDFEAFVQASPLLYQDHDLNRQRLPTLPASKEQTSTTNANSPNIIIGSDDRVKVTDTNPFPWSTVVHIRGKFGTGTFNCSGWMLGVSTVVTAGHCLYDFGNSNLFASSLVVTPAQNTDSSPSEPFGNCEADRVWIINVWQDTGDSRYDYGVIGLTCRVGERTGNLGYRIMADDVITGTRVNVTGYPGDKGGTTMWFGLGNVTDVDQHYLYYNNDTMGSQSGSPVWELINDDCEDCVVAIHSGANPPANTNIGVRVDSYLFDFLIVLQQWQYGRAFLPLILKPQPTPRNTPCFGC